MKKNDLAQVGKILEIKFNNKSLIEQAFTHKSKSVNINNNNE